jgi:hypothetical protein
VVMRSGGEREGKGEADSRSYHNSGSTWTCSVESSTPTMDQDAFRSLLSTSSSSSSTPSSSKSRFGQQPPKRTIPSVPLLLSFTSSRARSPLFPTNSSAKDGALTDFKPRQKKDYKPKKAPDGSVYRDRAMERRLGKEGDFAQAEKLLEVRRFLLLCFPFLAFFRSRLMTHSRERMLLTLLSTLDPFLTMSYTVRFSLSSSPFSSGPSIFFPPLAGLQSSRRQRRRRQRFPRAANEVPRASPSSLFSLPPSPPF